MSFESVFQIVISSSLISAETSTTNKIIEDYYFLDDKMILSPDLYGKLQLGSCLIHVII